MSRRLILCGLPHPSTRALHGAIAAALAAAPEPIGCELVTDPAEPLPEGPHVYLRSEASDDVAFLANARAGVAGRGPLRYPVIAAAERAWGMLPRLGLEDALHREDAVIERVTDVLGACLDGAALSVLRRDLAVFGERARLFNHPLHFLDALEHGVEPPAAPGWSEWEPTGFLRACAFDVVSCAIASRVDITAGGLVPLGHPDLRRVLVIAPDAIAAIGALAPAFGGDRLFAGLSLDELAAPADDDRWQPGRDVPEAFDRTAYLARYPDVLAAGADPLFHYVFAGGHQEGREARRHGVRQADVFHRPLGPEGDWPHVEGVRFDLIYLHRIAGDARTAALLGWLVRQMPPGCRLSGHEETLEDRRALVSALTARDRGHGFTFRVHGPDWAAIPLSATH